MLATRSAVYLVEITLQADAESYARLIARDLSTRSIDGVALFEFQAEVFDPRVVQVALDIRPGPDPNFYRQQCGVANSVVRCVAQIGSASFRLVDDQDYWFRLVQTTGDVSGSSGELLFGKMVARVTRLARVDQWVLVMVGLLASVIQIVEALVMAGFEPFRPGQGAHAQAAQVTTSPSAEGS